MLPISSCCLSYVIFHGPWALLRVCVTPSHSSLPFPETQVPHSTRNCPGVVTPPWAHLTPCLISGPYSWYQLPLATAVLHHKLSYPQWLSALSLYCHTHKSVGQMEGSVSVFRSVGWLAGFSSHASRVSGTAGYPGHCSSHSDSISAKKRVRRSKQYTSNSRLRTRSLFLHPHPTGQHKLQSWPDGIEDSTPPLTRGTGQCHWANGMQTGRMEYWEQ